MLDSTIDTRLSLFQLRRGIPHVAHEVPNIFNSEKKNVNEANFEFYSPYPILMIHLSISRGQSDLGH